MYRHDPDEEDGVAEQDDADWHGVGEHLQVFRLGCEWAPKHAAVNNLKQGVAILYNMEVSKVLLYCKIWKYGVVLVSLVCLEW